jgi:hypothetical protein
MFLVSPWRASGGNLLAMKLKMHERIRETFAEQSLTHDVLTLLPAPRDRAAIARRA